MKRLHFILFSLIFTSCLYGHNVVNQIDSLEQLVINYNKIDTIKINRLIQLEIIYYNKSIEKFDKYIDEIKQGSRALNYNFGISKGYYFSSFSYQIKGNYLKALDEIYQSIEYAQKDNNNYQLSLCYGQLSQLLLRNTNLSKSNNESNALKYAETGLDYAYKSKNPIAIHNLLMRVIILNNDIGNYDKAEVYLSKGKQNFENIKDSLYFVDLLNQEGCILNFKKNYLKAIKILILAQNTAELYDNSILLGMINQHLGDSYLGLNNYDKAEYYYLESLKVNKLKSPDIVLFIINSLKDIYNKKQDYKKSLYYTDLYFHTRDSINKISSAYEFSELMIKYNSAIKDKENTELKLQNQKKERSLNFILGILLLFVIGILLLTYLYRKLLFTKEKLGLINQELETSNHYKDMIFKIVSHDLKMPTNNLLTLTQRLDAKIPNISTDWLIDYSKKINLIAVNTVNTVNNLLFWSNKEANNSVIIEDIYIFDCIHDILETFNIYAKVLQKTLSFECENRNLAVKCNRVQFLTLLKNIISNAIKYSALENGVILIKTFAEKDHVIITVEDNGNGDFENVSSIFFSTEQNKLESHMSGMGFKICKEIATKYSIIISFEQSEKLKGIKVGIKI